MFVAMPDVHYQVLTSLNCQIAHRAVQDKVLPLAVRTTALLTVVHAIWQQMIAIL
jgi:hypothetical protein